jgi:enoyl-CoA hydratase
VTDERTVLVERHGRVGLAILNRPAKLNAMNTPLLTELEAALQAFDADDDIGAIVITGAGERAFSAGGDMKEQIDRREGRIQGPGRLAPHAIVAACRKPVIAAIRGYCFGGAASLAVNCDIRIAGDDARFKLHGASYGRAVGSAVLPRIVGEAKAKELLFTGDEVNAQEGLRIGLYNQVVAPDQVLQTALDMGARIAANSLPAVLKLKEIVDLALPYQAAQELEDEVNRTIRNTDESWARFRRAAEKVVGPS